jgi:hypothetical protein
MLYVIVTYLPNQHLNFSVGYFILKALCSLLYNPVSLIIFIIHFQPGKSAIKVLRKNWIFEYQNRRLVGIEISFLSF